MAKFYSNIEIIADPTGNDNYAINKKALNNELENFVPKSNL